MKQSVCITFDDGTQHWLLPDGTLHREDGPAVLYPNGDNIWYFDGRFHRENGPAIEFRYHGTQNTLRAYEHPRLEWFIHGKRHREDGPARINSDGTCEWYVHGQFLPVKTQQEFEQYMRMKVFW
jgi:hypothetical protein